MPFSGVTASAPVAANIAPVGEIDVETLYGNAGAYTNINASTNPSTTTPSSTNAWVWNSWGSTKGTAADPYYVTLTWPQRYELESMRIMWWACRSLDAQVDVPRSARVEYRDLTTGAWVDAGAVGVEYNGNLGNINPTSSSGWSANTLWNEVVFPSAIKTDAIRLRVVANKDSGTAPGFGINRWQVYGWEVDELASVSVSSVSGNTSLVVGFQEEYQASVYSPKITGVTYEWSLDNANARIVSTNGDKAVLEGLIEGPAKLSVKAKHSSGALETIGTFDIKVIERKALLHTMSTAAGKQPILPKRIVMQGVQFDTPSAPARGNNGWNFGEEFPNSLIPVTWDAVNPADYAADKVGSTFTVNGTVTYDGKSYPAKAEVYVNTPLSAPTTNNIVTSEHVKLDDVFWKPKQIQNAGNGLDRAFIELSSTASQRNAEKHFIEAIKRLNGEPYDSVYNAYVFRDSDIYKTLEGMAYTLFTIDRDTDPAVVARKAFLEEKINQWVEWIEAVQYSDGYLNTAFALRDTANSGTGGDLFGTTGQWRWRYMARHEMYNIGHFLEAAVAYTRYREGAGRPDYRLYEVGKRVSNHLYEWFGPGGKRTEVPGHEEAELALMKFATLIEEYEGAGAGQKYRDTAKRLIDGRGNGNRGVDRESGYFPGYSGLRGTYSQDRTPLVDEVEIVGHAVRATYYLTGATNVAAALPESDPDRIAYLKTLTALSDRLIERNTYITGGVGTSQSGGSSEGFGPAYYLSNNQAYCESCAAIATANWHLSMGLVFEDTKYADAYEKALYNHVLVGMNLSGGLFYYGSRLENGSAQNRNTWDGVGCCPPNIIRTLANIGGYLYTVNKNNLFINMYAGSNSDINVEGTNVNIIQETDYPWDGAVKMTVAPAAEKAFTMNIRIPGWVKAQKYQQVSITVDGQAINAEPNEKGYVVINRTWPAAGTVIQMDIPMEIRLTEPDNNVNYGDGSNTAAGTNRDKVAIERGPLVYCVETPGLIPEEGLTNDARQVRIPRDMEFTATWRDDLLRGIVEITGTAKYGTDLVDRDIQLIPHYAWNNRGNDPNNMGMGETGNGCSTLNIWFLALDETTQIRSDKNMIAEGETTKLTAVPHVNNSSVKKPASYEWSAKGPVELVNTTAGLTDNIGPGKIGGIDFELPTGIADVKALNPGVATVQAVMKDSGGAVIGADAYDVEVLGEISASSTISVVAQSVYSSLASTNTYSNRFMLEPKADTKLNMIIAEYNDRGALKGTEVRPLDLKAGDSVFETVTVPRDSTYKVFFWDANYVPLTEVVYYW